MFDRVFVVRAEGKPAFEAFGGLSPQGFAVWVRVQGGFGHRARLYARAVGRGWDLACARRLHAAIEDMGLQQHGLAYGAREVGEKAAVIGRAMAGAFLGLFDGGGGRAWDGRSWRGRGDVLQSAIGRRTGQGHAEIDEFLAGLHVLRRELGPVGCVVLAAGRERVQGLSRFRWQWR